jgi:hypothetical protein
MENDIDEDRMKDGIKGMKKIEDGAKGIMKNNDKIERNVTIGKGRARNQLILVN